MEKSSSPLNSPPRAEPSPPHSPSARTQPDPGCARATSWTPWLARPARNRPSPSAQSPNGGSRTSCRRNEGLRTIGGCTNADSRRQQHRPQLRWRHRLQSAAATAPAVGGNSGCEGSGGTGGCKGSGSDTGRKGGSECGSSSSACSRARRGNPEATGMASGFLLHVFRSRQAHRKARRLKSSATSHQISCATFAAHPKVYTPGAVSTQLLPDLMGYEQLTTRLLQADGHPRYRPEGCETARMGRKAHTNALTKRQKRRMAPLFNRRP